MHNKRGMECAASARISGHLQMTRIAGGVTRWRLGMTLSPC